MTTLTANIILVIIACTWAYLSADNGYFMPLSADLLKICAVLAGGSGAIAAAEKFGGKK